MIQRELTNRHRVDDHTGAAHSTNPAGGWDRGALYRSAVPVIGLPPLWPTIDYSTQPPTLHYWAGGQLVRVVSAGPQHVTGP